MKVGDLVTFPNSVAAPQTGIVLREERPEDVRTNRFHDTDNPRVKRVEVYWIEDAESSWEPVKWMEVISESR